MASKIFFNNNVQKQILSNNTITDIGIGGKVYKIKINNEEYHIGCSSDISGKQAHEVITNSSGEWRGGETPATNSNVSYNPKYAGLNYISNDYKGEWIYIRVPEAFILSGYTIRSNNNRPKNFKVYGSNNGTYWTEIEAASNYNTLYSSNTYTKEIRSDKLLQIEAYSYIGFVFNEVSNMLGSDAVIIQNLVLYGYDVTESSYFGISDRELLKEFHRIIKRYRLDYKELDNYFTIQDLNKSDITDKYPINIQVKPIILDNFSEGYVQEKYVKMMTDLYSNEYINTGINNIIQKIKARINDDNTVITEFVEKDLNILVLLLKAIQLRAIYMDDRVSEESKADIIEVMRTFNKYGVQILETEPTIDFQYIKYPEVKKKLKDNNKTYDEVNSFFKDNSISLDIVKNIYSWQFILFIICLILFIGSIIAILYIDKYTSEPLILLLGITGLFAIILLLNMFIRYYYIEGFENIAQNDLFDVFFNGMIIKSIDNIKNTQTKSLKSYMERSLNLELNRGEKHIHYKRKYNILMLADINDKSLWSLLYADLVMAMCIGIISYLVVKLILKKYGMEMDYDITMKVYGVLGVFLIGYLIYLYERNQRLNFRHKFWAY